MKQDPDHLRWLAEIEPRLAAIDTHARAVGGARGRAAQDALVGARGAAMAGDLGRYEHFASVARAWLDPDAIDRQRMRDRRRATSYQRGLGDPDKNVRAAAATRDRDQQLCDAARRHWRRDPDAPAAAVARRLVQTHPAAQSLSPDRVRHIIAAVRPPG